MSSSLRFVLSLTGLLVALFGSTLPTAGQQAADANDVRRAALDYLEGFYEGDAAKIRRSVHSSVTKYGFYKTDPSEAYTGEPMSYQEMIDFANRVRETGRLADPEAPKEVLILDVQDQTAVVKVTAWWGTDYLQMARYDGKWMILHVLWQSPPPNN